MRNCETLLPVLTADIIGPEEQKKGNVLLDSGAQISLIRLSLAERLNLNGKDINITITKVGGEQDHLKTKRFPFKIRSLSNQQIHSVSAIGVPCISDDVHQVEIEDRVKQFGLSSDQVNREEDPIDVLIGIDYAKMHRGETKQIGDLIARKSPLGWALLGVSGRNIQETRVMHVKLTSPCRLDRIPEYWSYGCKANFLSVSTNGT